MIEGVLAVAGALLGAWVWWLKNRSKSRLQKADEEIKEKNEARKKAVDGWVRGVDSGSWWHHN